MSASRQGETVALQGVNDFARRLEWAGETGKLPTEEQVLAHLRSLLGWEAMAAEEYVRRAPVQIQTPHRVRIERELGCTFID